MSQAAKVPGLTFYSPIPEGGEGFIIWALIGGTWQRYHHETDEAAARRQTNKIGQRLQKAAARRREAGG